VRTARGAGRRGAEPRFFDWEDFRADPVPDRPLDLFAAAARLVLRVPAAREAVVLVLLR
jgi:hypothetical protein